MELRQYWNVIWRRRWLVLAIVLLSALGSAAMAFTAKRSYETETWFATRQENREGEVGGSVDIQGQVVFTFDRNYYRWFGSEFLVDDYTLIAQSDAFANSVLQTLREEPAIMDFMEQDKQAGRTDDQKIAQLKADIAKLRPIDVKNSIGADRRHRNLHLTITGGTPELTKAIADSAAVVLTGSRIKPVMGEMVDDHARFWQMDAASFDNIESSRNKEIINAVTRAVMGIVAALAIAFLLEYLDNSVRDERDAQRVLELPVLGAIPRA